LVGCVRRPSEARVQDKKTSLKNDDEWPPKSSILSEVVGRSRLVRPRAIEIGFSRGRLTPFPQVSSALPSRAKNSAVKSPDETDTGHEISTSPNFYFMAQVP